MQCIRCERNAPRRDGQTRLSGQRWRCQACGRRFTARSTSAFSRHCFPNDIIALAVRHSVRYRLSFRDRVFAGHGRVVDETSDEAIQARTLFGPKYGEWQPGQPKWGWTWEALPVAVDLQI